MKVVNQNSIRECTNCVLDTHDDPFMTFDENGVCNYCRAYQKTYILNGLTDDQKKEILEGKLAAIKKSKKGKYDTILGVSGGVDSTYAAYICKQLGLNPLLVHFDNGWNSELAVSNIEQITKITGFDLYTYVVDWPEFRDLQLAYIKASVLDWEIPTTVFMLFCITCQISLILNIFLLGIIIKLRQSCQKQCAITKWMLPI